MRPSLVLVALVTVSLLALSVSAQDSTEKTKMIIEVIRHGARVPIYAAAKEDWIRGLQPGDLTDVGKRQHYLLGKELVKQFSGFFTDKFAAEEYYVRASGFQRTVASAQSHLLGMWDHFVLTQLDFQNGDIRTVPPSVSLNTVNTPFRTPLPKGYIPDPIHTDSLQDDELLYFIGSEVCPIGKDMSRNSINSIRTEADKNPDFTAFVKQVQQVYGLPEYPSGKSLFDACVELADFAYQDSRVNPTPKISTSHELFKRLTRCYEVNIVGKFLNPQVKKMIPTPLMEDIMQKLKDKTNSTLRSPLKFQLYSGHDSTIAPILSLLGLLDVNCFVEDLKQAKHSDACKNFPDVASNLVFELVTVADAYFVKTFYNFGPIDVCGLKNEAEKYRCPISKFEESWKSKLSSNWKKECGTTNLVLPGKPEVKTSSIKTAGWILIFLAGILIISLACLIVTLVTLPKPINEDMKLYSSNIEEHTDNTIDYGSGMTRRSNVSTK